MERAHLAALLGAGASSTQGTGRVVEEADHGRFMASFSEAIRGDRNVFLGNPAWQASEREELERIVKSGRDAGDRGWLMIPSGGAGGGLKFARHDGWTIAAAVEGFRRHFGMDRVNAVSVLPLHHVSGFMAWMRSALTGGAFVPWSWKEAEGGRLPSEISDACCLSLVPTQLQRLLASGASVEWLRRFRIIFVGGGPAWGTLLEDGARLGLPLSPCYGATETAAMVAALKPEQFLGGVRGCGAPMPHARIDLDDGVVRITGESVFRGYFPATRDGDSWTTGDSGIFTPEGSLVILGRNDGIIVTGGKKVFPDEVEEALRSSGEFDDVAVIGVPDPEWGRAVVACHPTPGKPIGMERIKASLSRLASFKHPKRYVPVSPWPRNAQGKIDRAELFRIASSR